MNKYMLEICILIIFAKVMVKPVNDQMLEMVAIFTPAHNIIYSAEVLKGAQLCEVQGWAVSGAWSAVILY